MNSSEEYSRAITQKRITELEYEVQLLRAQNATLLHQHANDEAAMQMLTYNINYTGGNHGNKT